MWYSNENSQKHTYKQYYIDVVFGEVQVFPSRADSDFEQFFSAAVGHYVMNMIINLGTWTNLKIHPGTYT